VFHTPEVGVQLFPEHMRKENERKGKGGKKKEKESNEERTD
jgi:hypothetical protein